MNSTAADAPGTGLDPACPNRSAHLAQGRFMGGGRATDEFLGIPMHSMKFLRFTRI